MGHQATPVAGDTGSPARGASSVALGAMAVDQVLLAAPGGSAPAWRWPSRPWPGWCGPSSRPCTATTRSCTTSGWSTASRTSAWSSSTTSTRCRQGARSCCRPTARPPRSSTAAQANGGYVVDAVCPLVTKVHHEVKVRAGKGYRIVYVGHEGHEEAVGTMAVAPDAIHRVERHRGRRRPARSSTSPWRCSPRPRSSHRDWAGVLDAATRALPRPVAAGPHRPLLRHHQPPVRR